jgi:MFS family permease
VATTDPEHGGAGGPSGGPRPAGGLEHDGDTVSSAGRPLLHGWRHPSILAAACFAVFSGFAQFGVSTALADVARQLGEPAEQGTSLAAQVGLSGTALGIGLAVIRLAAVGSMPLAGLADQLGRRRVLVTCSMVGLALTAVAAGSPTFVVFVILIAAARPLLSATNALAGLVAAEDTGAADRSKAVALVTAGYGIGAGLTGLLRGVVDGLAGFRGVFLMALLPLALAPLLARLVREPARFASLRRAADAGRARLRAPVLGALDPALRGRLLLMGLLWLAFSVVTGPGNTFVFLYSEGVLGLDPLFTAVMLVSAGPCGLAGLVAGRFLADRLGRRWTAAGAHIAVAAALAITYSGTPAAAVGGYVVAMFAGATYAPATGAMAAELFPTSVRGSVAGWLAAAGVVGAVTGLVVFGLLADALGGFTRAALLIAVPVALVSVLFRALPETRGQELEDSAPDRGLPGLGL